jgi:putative ABC transport system substrate-binding protein
MKRRQIITLVCGAIATLPSLARAQASRIPRVGVLWHAGSAAEEGSYYTGLLEGFRDLGYVDGRNIILEHRFPNEMPERFRSMVAELVALKVDVLVTVGTQTAPYARDATTSIPVVFIFVPTPGQWFRRQPGTAGRNMTGLSHWKTSPQCLHFSEIYSRFVSCCLPVNPNTGRDSVQTGYRYRRAGAGLETDI